MDVISFALEIIRQVPLWAATAAVSGGFFLWLGYKIGSAMAWVRERALRQALEVTAPKMRKEED